eukprot:3213063-Rhodomonas_salina.4
MHGWQVSGWLWWDECGGRGVVGAVVGAARIVLLARRGSIGRGVVGRALGAARIVRLAPLGSIGRVVAGEVRGAVRHAGGAAG